MENEKTRNQFLLSLTADGDTIRAMIGGDKPGSIGTGTLQQISKAALEYMDKISALTILNSKGGRVDLNDYLKILSGAPVSLNTDTKRVLFIDNGKFRRFFMKVFDEKIKDMNIKAEYDIT
ncbi:MAG: hypothetical protein ACK559_22335, partial [bacterium]